MKIENFKLKIKSLPKTIRGLIKTSVLTMGQTLKLFFQFSRFFFFYCRKKVISSSIFFEKNKNVLVKFFMMKRGRYSRPFLHVATMAVLGIGVLITPFIADTYPIFAPTVATEKIETQLQKQSIMASEDVFKTHISQKPRDKVVTYRVEKGDTLSTIAEKFDVSLETIKWLNNLKSDSLTVGDEIQVLPVSGVQHKVLKGETVYSIAKKYDTNPQKIVDFPFNNFVSSETFALVEGQMLIVPDGVMPAEKPVYRRQVYIAQGPVTISSAGFTWPLRGGISQFSSWYHTALDITSPIGTPIVAAQSGKVVKASAGTWDGGYGTNVEIDNGSGYSSLYAHMSGLNVSAGDDVVAGKTVVGWIGMTGRTTGPHIHFEIRKGGALVNPMSYLQ